MNDSGIESHSEATDEERAHIIARPDRLGRSRWPKVALGAGRAIGAGLSEVSVDVRRLFEETLPRVLADAGSDGSECLFSPDVAVAFDIVDAGRWEVRGPDSGVGVDVVPWEGQVRDCVVRCDTPTFETLLGGGLRAARAYASGRAQVEGDVGLLLRLRDALDGRIDP